jgi:hypothetical protein
MPLATAMTSPLSPYFSNVLPAWMLPPPSPFKPLPLASPRNSVAARSYSPQIQQQKRMERAADEANALKAAAMGVAAPPAYAAAVAGGGDAAGAATGGVGGGSAAVGGGGGGGALPSEKEMADLGTVIAAACGPCKKRLAGCSGEQDCSNAAISLAYCMGQVLCEKEVGLSVCLSISWASAATSDDMF